MKRGQVKEKPAAAPRGQEGGAGRAGISPGRRWLFRTLALTFTPVLFLLLLEAGLRVVHYGYPTDFFRTVTIQGQMRVVENDKFSWRFFPRSLARHPLPVNFSAAKRPGTYRVFVMGESAAMGDPDPAFSFSRVLQVLLQERFAGTHFEVINVAFTAISSHVILPIARECARERGDLWIVYMGHNEVPGPFGPGTVFGSHRSSLALIRLSIALKATRIGQWVAALQERWQGTARPPQTWRGLGMFLDHQFRRDDARLQSMYAHYRANLDDMIRAARRAGTEIVLCTPASNLKDSAPFASLHAKGLDNEQKTAWEKVYQAGIGAENAGQTRNALALFKTAAGLDPEYADGQFRAGRAALELGQGEEARASLRLARDLDTLRFRTDSRLNEIVQETARAWSGGGVFFCDTVRALAQSATNGVPGDDFFFDHVHLTFHGNYVLARSIAEQVQARLPAALRTRDAGQWAAAEVCAQRLALTDWNQYQMHEVMQRRLLEAPFTNQLNHLERQRHYLDRLAQLRPALGRDRLEAAAQACRDALTHAPDDPNLHENCGRILAALGDDEGAVAEFQRLSELWPEQAAPYNNLGLLFHRLGRLPDAERAFHEALRRRPAYPDALNGLGLALAAQGQTDSAIRLYEQALQQNPELAEAKVNLGQAWQRMGKMDEAERCYEDAVRSRPNLAAAQQGLGELLLRQGKFFEAMPHLAEAARAQPEASLARAQETVQSEPNDALAYFRVANVYSALNQPAEALQNLQTAVRLKTDFWQARYLLGVELAERGRLPEAQDQFAAVTRLAPDYVRAHLNLGVALAKQLRLADAAGQFAEVLRLEPTNQTAQRYLQTIRSMTNAPPSHSP